MLSPKEGNSEGDGFRIRSGKETMKDTELATAARPSPNARNWLSFRAWSHQPEEGLVVVPPASPGSKPDLEETEKYHSKLAFGQRHH